MGFNEQPLEMSAGGLGRSRVYSWFPIAGGRLARWAVLRQMPVEPLTPALCTTKLTETSWLEWLKTELFVCMATVT